MSLAESSPAAAALLGPADRIAAFAPSSNVLRDAVQWLNGGDLLVLQAGGKIVPYGKPALADQDPETFAVMYLDISSDPSLGGEDEWPWYFESSAGAVLCLSEQVQKLVTCPATVPHVVHMVLNCPGYVRIA